MRTVATNASVLALLGACQASAAETYKSPQGTSYTVERVAGLKPEELPINTDLKMADRDLAKYAETLCALDVRPEFAPARCDIYVQADRTGTLIGYTAVMQGTDGIRFETATTTNEKSGGGEGCHLGGKLRRSGMDYEKPLTDASRDFEAQMTYSAWEKAPGKWMVAEVNLDSDSTDANPDAANGVWYVKKQGNKLRITQERWNYCYRDNAVNMDDVFYRAISLVRTPG